MNCNLMCSSCEKRESCEDSDINVQLTLEEYQLSRQLDKDAQSLQKNVPEDEMNLKYVHNRVNKEEYIRERNRRWEQKRYKEHKEERLNTKKQQYQRHKEERLQYQKEYYNTNKEECRLRSHDYYYKHREEINQRRREARKRKKETEDNG